MPASLITDAQVHAHQIQQWAVLVSERKLEFFPTFLVQKLFQMHERQQIGRMCLHKEEIYLSGCDYV